MNFVGFDSFEGLPQGWAAGPWFKGQYSQAGAVPVIDDKRVKFFKGWFNQTLPTYSVPDHEVLVVNLDADIYSSTIYVLQWLRPLLKSGSFIYFDEFNHVEDELRAFEEYVAETGLKFKPVATDGILSHLAFECDGVAKLP